MRHSTIQFGKNTVTKSTAPELMRVEIEKTRRAFEIGKNCELFRVPEVLDYDEVKGVAVFERIKRIQPAKIVLKDSSKYRSLIEQIGRSLAIIHQKLALPDDMSIPIPSEFNLPGTEVFLHGDFNGSNICVSMFKPSVVILDWQMTSRHGGQATYGSRYFDVIWFVNYMLWSPTVFHLFSDPVAPMARSFLESYYKESKILYDPTVLVRYSKDFFEKKLPSRKQHARWKSSYILKRSHNLTTNFLELLKTMVLG